MVEKEFAKKQANFIVIQSSIVVKKAKDIVNLNFKESMWAHLLGYTALNLDSTIEVHKQAQQ